MVPKIEKPPRWIMKECYTTREKAAADTSWDKHAYGSDRDFSRSLTSESQWWMWRTREQRKSCCMQGILIVSTAKLTVRTQICFAPSGSEREMARMKDDHQFIEGIITWVTLLAEMSKWSKHLNCFEALHKFLSCLH